MTAQMITPATNAQPIEDADPLAFWRGLILALSASLLFWTPVVLLVIGQRLAAGLFLLSIPAGWGAAAIQARRRSRR